MDKNQMMNYCIISFIRVAQGKILAGSVFIIMIVTLFIMRMNKALLPSMNNWDHFFVIFSNSYTYFLIFLTSFLVIIHDIFHEGAIFRLVASRLSLKKEILLVRYILIIGYGFIMTVLTFGSVLILSIINHGEYVGNWSEATRSLELSYTSFALELSPLQAMALYVTRYFLGLLAVGFIYSVLYTLFMGQKVQFLFMFLFLFSQSLIKFGQLPVINFLDLGTVYIYSYQADQLPWMFFLLLSQIHIIIVILISAMTSLYLIREVEIS